MFIMDTTTINRTVGGTMIAHDDGIIMKPRQLLQPQEDVNKSVATSCSLSSKRNSIVVMKQQKLSINKIGQQRIEFALLLKILLKGLKQDDVDLQLVQEVKTVVKYYTTKGRTPNINDNNNGGIDCLLVKCMEKSIRALVGEQHWMQSYMLMKHYINQHNNDSMSSSKTTEECSTTNMKLC